MNKNIGNFVIPKSNNSFIDENHSDLLLHLSGITEKYSEAKQVDRSEFSTEMGHFCANIENHFNHEEVILQGAGFDQLDEHRVQHRKISMALRQLTVDIQSASDLGEIIEKVTSELVDHELSQDQQYWYLFEEDWKEDELLLRWSKDLETGVAELDTHHVALMNHINRFYLGMIKNNDLKHAGQELKILKLYSHYHFQEEEKVLGEHFHHGHKVNHAKLLSDLGTLIEEINSGKFVLANLSHYMDFWFLNHIKQFDVPAAANLKPC